MSADMPVVETYEAVRACCIATLAGHVLHAEGLSASAGAVIDWRTRRCGETLQEGDAFDVAHLFVAVVGGERAHQAAAALGVCAYRGCRRVRVEVPR